MGKDTLYRQGQVAEDFTFNNQVAQVFDDMLCRSVPWYREVIGAMAELIRLQDRQPMTICDLGCATGTTLIGLARQLPQEGYHLIGIDNAPAMLAKAREKVAAAGISPGRIRLVEDDITCCRLEQADVFLVNYTLQFLRPLVRQPFLARLHRHLNEEGMVILSEKVISADARINRLLIRMYHRFKRRKGYSDLEIAAKREALENVLVPYTVEENLVLLREAGFARVEVFCRWCNFASFLACKR